MLLSSPMNNLFSKKVLYFIPMVFLIVILMRVSYAYYDLENKKHDFALKIAEVLNDYAMVHRNHYQKFFIDKVIPLNEATLPALPAFSSTPISELFSQKNTLHVIIKTVSDRARNSDNQADSDELKAINHFKNNTNEKSYFTKTQNDFFQFAHPLRIEEKCLSCHGSKESAPLFIQNKYSNAYDYHLGEVRGIQSVKIPIKMIDSYLMSGFVNSIIYDITLFVLLFILIYILIKKFNMLNIYLTKEVETKTDELKKTLSVDSLTLLPNRLQLLEDIQKTKNCKSTMLALLNINRFNDINDFYGFKSGDVVLNKVATSLKQNCDTPETYIYKLPGDEFAIYTTKDISDKSFKKIIQTLVSKLQTTNINAFGNSILISLSVGISSNKDFLLATANMALNVAKRDVKNIIVYDNTINKTHIALENIEGIKMIKDALEADTIVPYFQPIFNLQTKKIEKYESLVRIIKNDGTVASPFSFLEIAIKSKLYPNITQIMIEKSFDFFMDKEYEFSINLSTEDIRNKHTTNFILKKLQEYPEPQKVVFEILESDEIQNYQELKEFIKKIKHFGCKFAIDDFGSGYSNFSHVLELNIDYLKIDASLVKYITTDENSRVITKTIINFASTLGLKTIAEYVEDKEAFDLLEKMGIDYIQGYYIGKPEAGLNTTY